MSKLKISFLVLFSLGIGILLGGYMFSQSQPRSIISINHCQNCLSHADLLGLIASVGIQRFPELIPSVTIETDKTVAIRLPSSSVKRIHFVIIPKKDIKNIGEISEATMGYLVDAFLVAREIIEKERLSKYYIYTNGPGFQDVTYLHFHMIAGDSK
jgi:diadenosine tetraphosphate (Ap4A) HIT family hydrolase